MMLRSIERRRRWDVTYIEDYHIEQANAILEWVVARLPKLFSFLGTSDVGEDAKRIIQTIYKNGGRIARQKLVGSLYGTIGITQLDERIRTLKQAGLIQQLEGGLFDETNTAVYYKLLKNPEDVT